MTDVLRLSKNRRKSTIQALNRMIDVLKKRKSEDYIRLGWELGYTSPEYFKRSVLPLFMRLNQCIDYDRDFIVWVCDEESREGGEQ